MNLKKSFRLALNIIVNSKLRSWLTIIGIVIGVASIISIVSIGSGFEQDIQKQLGGLGSDTIIITAGFDRANKCPGPDCHGPGEGIDTTGNELTQKEVQALRSISEISVVNPSITGPKSAYYLGETASVNVEGVDTTAWRQITTAKATEGRLLSPGDTKVVVIGHRVAEEMYTQDINLNRQIEIEDKSFRIIGILKESGGFGVDDSKVIMPLQDAEEVFEKQPNTYDAITVKVNNLDDIDAVEEKITQKLMIVRHVNEDTQDFTVLSMKTIQEQVSAILQGFTLFLGVIAAVSLLVGAVGISNTMFTSVLEKKKEIGIMKALGAKNKDVLAIFLLNSGLVGLVGGIIGVLIGVGISLLIPKIGVSFTGGDPLTTYVSANLIIFTLLFSIAIGMVAGAVPAYRASKLQPVDALRSE